MAEMILLDFQNCVFFIILCFFSLLCYYLFFKKTKDTQFGCDLPPSPPSLPIIGHLHLLLSPLTHKSLQKLSHKYGPLLHLRVFNVPILLVSSASVAYEIFRGQDVNLSSRGKPANECSLFFGSDGFVMAPYGDYWKYMKKLMVTKLLGPHALERSRGIRAVEVKQFYMTLLDKAAKRESVEIGTEAIKLTSNTICKMIMGRSCSEENGEAERVRDLVSESTALTLKILLENLLHKPLKKFGISLFRKKIMGVSCRFNQLLERILEEHEDKKDEDQEPDFMDELLAAHRDENAEFKLTKNHIKASFVDLLIAGTDTSRLATQWTLAEIIKNPNVHERLRREIDTVVGKTRLIQESDLPNLPYLQAVVKEGIRLHPPGSLYARTTREGCSIRGFYVPEKTPIVFNAYAVMRDPDTWEDPDEFKPERFLVSSRPGQEGEKEQALKYIPFGMGRRACPGVNLAYIFVGIAIGVMVQCFDWEIKGDKVNMEESPRALVLAMVHPLECIPVARNLPFNFKSADS
ncbi:unnamed protein product [Cochlearia groenlandica]